MKKLITLAGMVLSAVFIFMVASCESTKVTPATCSPIAIVSVSGNSSIPWYIDDRDKTSEDDGETGGMLSGIVNRTFGAHDPEIQTVNSRIDDAAATLASSLSRTGTISVIDHSVIEQTPVLKSNGNFFITDLGDSVPAEGYKLISFTSSKRNKDIAKQSGAKSVLYVTFEFRKQKVNVSLTKIRAAARVTMNVYLSDEEGHTLLNKKYSAVSTDTIPYANGHWDKEEIVKLYPETVESVVNQFIFDISDEAPAVTVSTNTAEDATATESDAASTAEATPLTIPTTVKKNADDSATTTTPDAAATPAQTDSTAQ